MSARVGLGYDVHRLESGRLFMLGGMRIPHESGPVGHSDGDVVLHAVTDAVLGAAGMGDIGDLFDDRDPENKGRASREFLLDVVERVHKKGLRVTSVDTVILLERPRLGPHKMEMRQRLAALLDLDVDRVGVRASAPWARARPWPRTQSPCWKPTKAPRPETGHFRLVGRPTHERCPDPGHHAGVGGPGAAAEPFRSRHGQLVHDHGPALEHVHGEAATLEKRHPGQRRPHCP